MKTTIKLENENLIKQTKQGVKAYVICPKCNRGDMQYGYKGLTEWVCTWIDCCFKTKEILSIIEIQQLIKLKTQLKQIKQLKI